MTLHRLPPAASGRGFSTPLTYGFNHQGAMVSELVDIDHRNDYRLKQGANTSEAIAKKVWTFQNNEHMLIELNNWLSGGNSYPFLTAFLGIAVGTVSAPAGIAWSIFSAALDSARSANSTQCYARVADELWMVEAVGLDDGDSTHLRQMWVVDPLRNGSSGPPASSWCIAEDRHELE